MFPSFFIPGEIVHNPYGSGFQLKERTG